ncbi:hypothetical protein AMS68_005393 [Peltaster fructicola]|uniref:C2 domain-containing protein n=1 Tax=Peltaster fructicola TaxID=286661 RepID=A0A6H0XYW6_9PEZI|nr:hypothetical protein AMS68_005393 [Peltaster fructicola]
MDDYEAEQRRHHEAPYNTNHPIPSIQRFRHAKEVRRAHAIDDSESEHGVEREQNELSRVDNPSKEDTTNGADDDNDDGMKDTSELNAQGSAKDRRKTLQKRKDERAERIVTDPVTHLPVKIHDFTSEALEQVDKNEPAYGSTPRTATGVGNKEKSGDQLKAELEEIVKGQAALQAEFPPPAYELVHKELVKVSWHSTLITTAGLTLSVGLAITLVYVSSSLGLSSDNQYFSISIYAFIGLLICALAAGLIYGTTRWADRRMQSLWDAAIWQSKFRGIEKEAEHHETETTVWLNSLLAAVWPLINPDLFTSLSDTLEDVMQASLPSVVRMVSVDDIGQGSESLRILGIRWLPTGAAGRAVSEDGKLQNADPKRQNSAQSEQMESDDQMTQGMSAEEGDFINLEVAFAYRASSSGSTFKDRMKDMHLYLAFYLPGNIKLPVWVDLRGAVGIMRLRLQLAPDPPFFGLCTLTLLGQPKIELSCVPLVKHGLNLMNLPILKGFVQGSIDAAMAEYVAPKSLTLDLRDMIVGDDFKKDVNTQGVLVIEVIRGYDFKIGDMGIPLIKDGSADPYVTVGWAKFGKPLWSTRILANEMEPIWNETTYVLVTPDELNVEERLRLQLWDSDRFTADDDLGRIEVDIKQLMSDSQTRCKMATRTDGFKALDGGKGMPGKLQWRVGYFPKLSIQKDQLNKQDFDKDTRSMEQLEEKVDKISKDKLRETQIKKGFTKDKSELEQQKRMELQRQQEEIIIDAPPPDKYPSGILSIQVHQITGLELHKLHKSDKAAESKTIDDEDEQDDLPSAYCNIILNHTKIYKTRTKPKNARPFFNAGTERFVGDWRNAELHVSVRDSRVHEDDALLGIVHLPLADIFKERSQVNGFWPLAGGVGYGRIRLSLVWRSVQLQAPRELLGWSLGTLAVNCEAQAIDLPDDLKNMKLKLHTKLSTAKMYPNQNNTWHSKRDCTIRLAVEDRYSTCFSIRFRTKGLTGSKTEAFAVLWLRDIPDEEEDQELTLPVWKGDFSKALKSSLDDCGDKVGSIKLKLTFWSGLGAAHSAWAIKHANIRDVVQVLETAHDNLETSRAEKQAGIVDESGNTDSSDSDSDAEDDLTKKTTEEKDKTDNEEKSGGIAQLADEVKDYKHNYKSIHRRQRGIMTWKAPRTAQWAFHSAEKVEHKLAGIFKRHSRGIDIETEV